MSTTSKLLRFALIADAAASGAMGVLMAAGAGILSGFLNLPQELLLYSGLFLIPYALGVAWTGTRQTISRPLAWLIVALNTGWVVESFALPFTGIVSPNGWGITFICAQALVVAAFAIAQTSGLRASRRTA